MLIIILTISLSVILAIAVVAVVAIIISGKKDYTQTDIVFGKGGINTDTGKFAGDNYFKGVNEVDTTVVQRSGGFSKKEKSNASFVLTVSNMSKSQVDRVALNNYIIFGRSPSENGFVLADDKSVSKEHFKIFLSNAQVYICDLNSSNHTYLNGKMIGTSPVFLNRGSTIKIGNTYLNIDY